MLAKHILNKKNQSNESTEGNLDFSKMILNFFQSLAQVSMHHKLQVLLTTCQPKFSCKSVAAANIISSFVLVYNALHSQMSDSTH